jgi:hypothetical protein
LGNCKAKRAYRARVAWRLIGMISRSYQRLLLQRLHQRLATVKGIYCNIFVKKMKASAAEAFLRGAVRKMIGPNKAHWRRVLAAGAIEFMIGPEVARWRRINYTLSRHVDGMEKCRRALELFIHVEHKWGL